MPVWNRKPSDDDIWRQNREAWLDESAVLIATVKRAIIIDDDEYTLLLLCEHLPRIVEIREEMWAPKLNNWELAGFRKGIIDVYGETIADFRARAEYLTHKSS